MDETKNIIIYSLAGLQAVKVLSLTAKKCLCDEVECMSTLALQGCLTAVLFVCQRALVREKASRLAFIRNRVYFLKHTPTALMNT